MIEAGRLQRRPVRNHPSSLYRAAGEQRDRAGAVIGTLGAVDAHGAAELGGDHHDGVAPAIAKAAFEFRKRAVEPR